MATIGAVIGYKVRAHRRTADFNRGHLRRDGGVNAGPGAASGQAHYRV